MKQIILFYGNPACYRNGFCSEKAVISAEQTSHDFAQIKEADGKVSTTFVVKIQAKLRW